MRRTTKTYTPAVRAWAARKASEARRQAQRIRSEQIPSGNWRRIRGKMAALDALASEASKFDRIAGAASDVDDSPTPF